jgi:hypothetical protein
MSPWAIGGAYGISAGLIIYAIEAGFVDESTAGPLVIGWAMAGLVITVLGVIRGKRQ